MHSFLRKMRTQLHIRSKKQVSFLIKLIHTCINDNETPIQVKRPKEITLFATEENNAGIINLFNETSKITVHSNLNNEWDPFRISFSF